MKCLAVLLFAVPLAAQNALAPAPPMGWNSWDSYGLSVTESEFRANADVLADKLKPYGWTYAVVDEGWYLANPEAKPGSFQFALDANGRYTPALNRFPSATGDAGLKPLADYIHSRGLKFGIHIIRGIPRQAVAKDLPIAGSSYRASDAADTSDACPWNADNYGVKANTAGQAYYDSIANLYATWGVDFVKIDCIASHPYKGDEIRIFSLALKKTGRPIVLSLSPGPAPLDKFDELRHYAQMWRISDDFWDHWGPWPHFEFSQGLLKQFTTAAQWAPYVGGGHWPDADMLPLGYLGPRPGAGEPRNTRLTPDEQRTVMTLWSIFRSPLIMGGNLTRLDDFTVSLLTNSDVLHAHQHSKNTRVVINAPDRAVWTAEFEGGRGYYVALFNLSDHPQTLHYSWGDLGLPSGAHFVSDEWYRKDTLASEINVSIQPHGCQLFSVM
jgi:alpha-galactosidase